MARRKTQTLWCRALRHAGASRRAMAETYRSSAPLSLHLAPPSGADYVNGPNRVWNRPASRQPAPGGASQWTRGEPDAAPGARLSVSRTRGDTARPRADMRGDRQGVRKFTEA
jgi:hypothetical protein